MQPPLWRGLAFVIGLAVAKTMIVLFGAFGIVLIVAGILWLILKIERSS